MFIPKLIQFKRNPNQVQKQSSSKIIVKPFVDIFLDTAGWYANGHIDRQQFLKAVIDKERFPYSQLSSRQVQFSWAIFDGNSFELVNKSTEDAQPITFIQDLDLLNSDNPDW